MRGGGGGSPRLYLCLVPNFRLEEEEERCVGTLVMVDQTMGGELLWVVGECGKGNRTGKGQCCGYHGTPGVGSGGDGRRTSGTAWLYCHHQHQPTLLLGTRSCLPSALHSPLYHFLRDCNTLPSCGVILSLEHKADQDEAMLAPLKALSILLSSYLPTPSHFPPSPFLLPVSLPDYPE